MNFYSLKSSKKLKIIACFRCSDRVKSVDEKLTRKNKNEGLNFMLYYLNAWNRLT